MLWATIRDRCKIRLLSVSAGYVRLRPDWPSLLTALHGLGQVDYCTANLHAALQVYGRYPVYEDFGDQGIFSNGRMHVRVRVSLWKHAIAVARRCAGSSVLQRSIEFLDRSGALAHRIQLSPGTSTVAFETILEEFVDRDQASGAVNDSPAAAAPINCSFPTPSFSSFLREWACLNDTLTFPALLRDFHLTRGQAFQVAQGVFTRCLQPRRVLRSLSVVARPDLNITFRVGNASCEQTHRGSARSIVQDRERFSIRTGQGFLRLNPAGIAAAWIVSIPARTGPAELLELHDSCGNTIVTMSTAPTMEPEQKKLWSNVLSAIAENAGLRSSGMGSPACA